MTLSTETWKPVPGFGGYYDVSDQGQVRSWHNGRHGRAVEPRFLTTVQDGHGYLVVLLRNKGADDRQKRVHSLVLEAFIGPRPDGMEACHNNGVPADNRLSNLRYDTPVNNQADRLEHGTHNRGERCGTHKLTLTQVEMICALSTLGVSQQEIARRFGISQPHVCDIVNGKKWGWRTEAADEFHSRTAT